MVISDPDAFVPVLRCSRRGPLPRYWQKDFITALFVIVWIERGACLLRERSGDEHQMAAGMAFKRYPDVPLDVLFDNGCVTWFLAAPRQLCAVLERCGLDGWDDPVINPGRDPAIATAFERLRRRLAIPGADGIERFSALAQMQELIADLHRRSRQDDPQRRYLEQACTLLREDLLTVPTIAEHCGMAYSTFRQLFKAQMACSPNAYRIRCRIERAQFLLSEGQPLEAVAEQLGYCDAFHLSTQFKRVCGLSPRAWKRQQGGL